LVKIAKQHEPHATVVADNLSLPHPPGTFDFAISIAVIHHLSTPTRRVEAVKAVLDILRKPSSSSAQGGGKALIYVWALEQKDSRRGWDEGHEQDVMVPWVLKQKKEKKARQRKVDGAGNGDADQEEEKASDDKTFLRYYHLYKKGELEQDIVEAGGVVLESGYEKDNWWAIASHG
jgi:tRNA (uracil-5-)-methyltransferase TRM9